MTKIFIYLFAVIITFTACNKDAAIEGGNNGKNPLEFVEIDTFKLSTKTVFDDAINGKNVTNTLLGVTTDPRIGHSKAAFYTQFSLSQNSFDLGNNPVLDSVVLVLDQTDSYGALVNPIDLNVYELSTKLLSDASYKNNTVLNVKPTTLASISNFQFNKGSQSIRIPLSSTFGNKLIDQFGTSIMESTDNFKDFFYGVYVNTITMAGDGMVSLNLVTDKSKLQLYFHSDSQSDTSYIFKIGAKEIRVNQYNHNTTSSQAAAAENTSDPEIAFISSMSNVKTVLRFPDLTNLKNVIINKAELTLYQADYGSTESTHFIEPAKLFLFQNLQDTTIAFLPDFTLAESSAFGGKIKLEEINGSNTNTYTFYITKYVQSLVNGTAKTDELYITNITNNEANRLKIGGGSHNDFPVKLNIIYTKTK